jgi:LSD1 subclass zinc finger protein
MDIDFAVGMEKWNESGLNTINYGLRKMQIMQQCQTALARSDRQGYRQLQWEFWNFYYRTFPAYLPPSLNTPDRYHVYLQICAESSTESAFDPKWQSYAARQQQLQSAVRYQMIGNERKAETRSFFELADFFMSITREGMSIFYDDPRYVGMHEFLPQSIHLKMKTSMFVQAWLPYLTDDDAARLLKTLGFSNEYVEIGRPKGHNLPCSSCGSTLFAPEGSYRVFCEKCRKTTLVKSVFFCSSCGTQNSVPEDPSRPIDCASCGISNRLIRPLMG